MSLASVIMPSLNFKSGEAQNHSEQRVVVTEGHCQFCVSFMDPVFFFFYDIRGHFTTANSITMTTSLTYILTLNDDSLILGCDTQ